MYNHLCAHCSAHCIATINTAPQYASGIPRPEPVCVEDGAPPTGTHERECVPGCSHSKMTLHHPRISTPIKHYWRAMKQKVKQRARLSFSVIGEMRKSHQEEWILSTDAWTPCPRESSARACKQNIYREQMRDHRILRRMIVGPQLAVLGGGR